MRVAAVQHDICWEDRDATLRRLEPLLVDVTADLVVLPEMFAVGFTMSPEVVEAPDGPTTEWLVVQAARSGAWIGGSIPVRVPGAALPSNVFTLVAPDGRVHRSAKRHPFPFTDEGRHLAPGEGHLVVDIDGTRVAPSICYDLRFPATYWPLAADTDVYVVAASWPDARRHHWTTLLAARAIENQAYVVAVNRVGSGGGLSFAGDSCVLDPNGEVLASTCPGVEAVLTAELDPALVAKVRAELPWMADRREG